MARENDDEERLSSDDSQELELLSVNCLTNYVDALQRQSFVRQLERRPVQPRIHESPSPEADGALSS